MTNPDDQIDRQLREAGDRWRSRRRTPRSIDGATFSTASLGSGGTRRLLASAGAVLAVIVIGVLVVVSLPPRDGRIANGSPSPSASATSTQTTSPTHSQSPEPTIRPSTIPSSEFWTPVSDTAFDDLSGGFDSVEVRQGTFFANARRCDDTACTHVLFSSSDGKAWTEVAALRVDDENTHEVHLQEDGRGGYLAAANVLHFGPGVGLWQSINGRDWDALGGQDTFDVTPDCQGKKHDSTDIFNVYETTDTLVALGRIYCRDVYAKAAWLSDDAITWHRSDEAMPVDRVVAGQNGYLGLQILGTQTEQAWYSNNGLSWTMSTLGTQPMNAAAVATGYVDISTSNGLAPASLQTSVDGNTWSTIDDSFEPAPATIISSDGNRAAFVSRDDTAMVSSSDGTRWDSYPLPTLSTEEVGSVYVTVLGNRLLLASYNTPRMWVADIPPE